MSESKTCSKCDLLQPLTNFHRCTQSKDGYSYQCKSCKSSYKAQQYQKHKEVISAKRKQKRLLEPGEEWKRKKQRMIENPDLRERYCQYTRERAKQYRINNPDKISEYNSRPEVRLRKQEANRIRMSRLQDRIAHRLRNRLNKALRNQNRTRQPKYQSTEMLLGCSFVEFTNYIESLWKPGMSWENYGFYGWHIDHIVPCAAFDLSLESEQAKCFHYTNMQPLWWTENLQKHDSV